MLGDIKKYIIYYSQVLLIHPSVRGTPTKLSLSVRFNSELANFSTASSRESRLLTLSFRMGSSNHLLNCSYTSSSSELNSVEFPKLHLDFTSFAKLALTSFFMLINGESEIKKSL